MPNTPNKEHGGAFKNLKREQGGPEKKLDRESIIKHIRNTIKELENHSYALEVASGLKDAYFGIDFVSGPEARVTKGNIAQLKYVVEGAKGGDCWGNKTTKFRVDTNKSDDWICEIISMIHEIDEKSRGVDTLSLIRTIKRRQALSGKEEILSTSRETEREYYGNYYLWETVSVDLDKLIDFIETYL